MTNKLVKKKSSAVVETTKEFLITPFRMTPERRRAWLKAHTLGLPLAFLFSWLFGVWNPLLTILVYLTAGVLPTLLIPSKRDEDQ